MAMLGGECSGCCGGSDACAIDCRSHLVSVLNNIIRPEDWTESFHVDFGQLNTDGPPIHNQFNDTLYWDYVHADGSTDRILFRAWQVGGSLYYNYALHAGRLVINVLHGLTINVRCSYQLQNTTITIGTRVADEITHVARDGTVTTWTRPPSETQPGFSIDIVVPHGGDSPFFTGTYSAPSAPWGTFEPISPIVMNLPGGSCQVFRAIIGTCSEPPACENGTGSGNPLP